MGEKTGSKKQAKKESLLNSAFRLFLENGFQQTSISEIVNGAGVAKGTFYLYFKDKNDIRNRLIASKTTQIFEKAYNAVIQQTGLETFEDKILLLIDNILDQLHEDKKLVLLLSKDLGTGLFRESVLYNENENSTPVPTLLARMVEESGRSYRTPSIMLYLIVEMISSASYTVLLRDKPITLEQLKPPLHDAVRGIMQQFQLS